MASMTNPMNAFAGMTPEEIDIARKQKLADMLTKQAEQPLNGQMVSGHYVAPSWTQMLAKGLSGYMAGRTSNQASDMQKQYGEKQRTDFMDTAQKYAAALKGTPEQSAPFQADNPFGEDLGNMQTVTPAVPGSRDAAMGVAMQSNSPLWQQVALQSQMEKAKQTPKDQFGAIMPQNYTPESLAKFQTSGSYGDLVPVMKGASFGQVNPGQFTPESLARYQITGSYSDLVPFRSPVQVDQGSQKTLYDPGTHQERVYGVSLKPGEQPAVKGQQAAAEATAKATVERTNDAATKGRAADSLISYIGEAENILNKGDATGSIAGAGLAAGKKAFGVSDASTQANQRLESIGAWMTANVPRMQGPQSDADRVYYQQMAGQVGDRKVPIGDRLAALKQLRVLQEKYKTIQGAPNSAPTLDDLMKKHFGGR